MRVLIDTNVLISYLVQPGREGSVGTVVHAALEGQFTLLMPQALLDELTVTVRNKPRLARRIPLEELDIFAFLLAQFGERVPKIEIPFPPVTRDKNDDYLLAYALVGAADYLVTGDKDLLALQGQITGLEIVTPSQFVEIL
jgi:putative PIN family toxin of toxin-antitoxin system